MARIIIMIAVLFMAGFVPLAVRADDVTAGGLKISAAWSRATPKGASVGGGYMKITNTGTAMDRLIGGSSSICGHFELHEMKMENDVMKMRPVANGIEIKPGQTIEFGPSGYHVMLIGLTRQLLQGDHFQATLEFAKAGKVDVDFVVEGIGARTGGVAVPGMQTKH